MLKEFAFNWSAYRYIECIVLNTVCKQDTLVAKAVGLWTANVKWYRKEALSMILTYPKKLNDV